MMDTAEKLIAIVSPRSVGGISLFEAATPITATTFDGFRSDPAIVAAASNKLRELGFRVLDEGPITLTIGGPPALYEKVFGIQLHKERVTVMEGREVEFLAAPGPPSEQLLKPPGELVNLIEGGALSVPPVFFESPLPPLAPPDPVAYRYLFVPDDVGLLLNADRVHRLGATGKGIKVAMPDTGFYSHQFYTWHGYRTNAAVLGAGASNPGADDYGHGTGEAANIFATAPDIELTPVKMGDPVDSFKKAVAAKPHVITCSWGLAPPWSPEDVAPNVLTPYAKALAAEIAAAVASGIVVCFAGGNGTFRGFPQGHPDIVSVGGVCELTAHR